MRRVVIHGATGSIGRSALDVARTYPEKLRVVGLSTHCNTEALLDAGREFRPEAVAISDPNAAAQSEAAFAKEGIEVFAGAEGLEALSRMESDIVLCGIVGAAGLRALWAAIDAGRQVALANKEPMVMAGGLLMDLARKRGVRVLPVDSEHNAIFQCLEGQQPENVHLVHLTASGGPFYRRDSDSLNGVTPEEAVKHPTWDMGAKISVDSATLMNKGLEIMEAMWLFDLPLEKIRVIVHPQSIVHSLVEFTDGSILAHLGVTDMRLPIQFALTWPERVQFPIARLELTQMQALTFDEPDFDAFPCLRLAVEAAREGGAAGVVLNAANEEAVDAFCRRALGFTEIASVVAGVRECFSPPPPTSLDEALAVDAEARKLAREQIKRIGTAV